MTLPLLALVLAATSFDDEETIEHPVPAYLPRSASVGVLWNEPAVGLNLRLDWEVELYERGRDALLAVVMLGTGLMVAPPTGIREHFQHTAVVGVGYQNTGPLFQWGFAVGLGPVWYRSSFDPRLPNRFESRVLGYAEGHGHIGFKVLPHLVVGALAGYASPWEFSPNFPGNIFVGGLRFGVYVGWR